ncbi:unnamed protein product [Scytosiphon promiscuus]
MARASIQHQRSLTVPSDLHRAAYTGSAERTMAVLLREPSAIDQRDPHGMTALILATMNGHLRIVTILLSKGASASIEDEDGLTALHASAAEGDLDATRLLVQAGADLDAACFSGHTPLHGASAAGHADVLRFLIEAGADPDKRSVSDRSTPLSFACNLGNVDAVMELLRGKADPLLGKRFKYPREGASTLIGDISPLDAAAVKGHADVVRALIQEVRIEGCGGSSGGVDALRGAATVDHVAVLTILAGAGVQDPTGVVLIAAIQGGSEASLKFLLQQQEDEGATRGVALVDVAHKETGYTPVYFAVASGRCTSRILRMLIDAGADTQSAIRVSRIADGPTSFNGTPIALAMRCLAEKRVLPLRREEDATEEQLRGLEAIRRLLLQAEAARGTPWLWHEDAHVPVDRGDGDAQRERGFMTSRATAVVLPIPTRRGRRHGVLFAAMGRYSRKA